MRALTILSLAGLSVVGPACSSHQDDVCQNIGDCSHRGDNNWIASCQAEAKILGSEAAANGCGGAFNQYYACADSSYSCVGATATFPGCDDELAALDECIAAASSGTACAMLSAAETACAGTADGGAGGGPPPACTTARDCQARCYLMSVSNVCAPRVDEIQNVTTCAAACPP